MRKVIRSGQFELRKNTCFDTVINTCAAVPRDGQEGTWITDDMKTAYIKLHKEAMPPLTRFFRGTPLWEGCMASI